MWLPWLIFVSLVIPNFAASRKPEEVIYEWKYINFTWPSSEEYQDAIANRSYIKENNAISGIKIWNESIYLTIPRWKPGVPATLVVAPVKPTNGKRFGSNDTNESSSDSTQVSPIPRSPYLEPYPNWPMQEIGDCSSLQSVLGMEIDPMGRMWILDTGRVNLLDSEPQNLCPPRLMILDLEQDGITLMEYEFPEEVANPNSSYLGDIVIDHEDGGFAYIADGDDHAPGIIVFSLEAMTSWKIEHWSMMATSSKFTIDYDDTQVTRPMNLRSIALSPISEEGDRTFYYSPLSSLELFSISTSALKDNSTGIDEHVINLGKKSSQSSGMVMSTNGRLIYGILTKNTVSMWNTKNNPIEDNEMELFHDDVQLQWPDSFAIDINGTLWSVSNRFQRFSSGSIDTSAVNFRVLKLGWMGNRNYQYYKNNTAPEWPIM
ncbi:hypothetical protein QAD02_006875 [Eretmocerus hayati]|uniref:Uncharacterized protein n=1 Tax=Eretmocerus hayati TaxID=131215 RepID=A0ACC2N263_9HYME|nr:hypothetical protein QAD02_006875 [Eretmocerus hayati]